MIYPLIPLDKNRTPMHGFPAAIKAKNTYSSENASASSVISVGHDTTTIEIAANGGPAVLRWVTTTDTAASVISATSGANFDHAIAQNTVRSFAIPKETIGVAAGSVVGVNRQYGLYQRVAIKSTGIASILLTEY